MCTFCDPLQIVATGDFLGLYPNGYWASPVTDVEIAQRKQDVLTFARAHYKKRLYDQNPRMSLQKLLMETAAYQPSDKEVARYYRYPFEALVWDKLNFKRFVLSGRYADTKEGYSSVRNLYKKIPTDALTKQTNIQLYLDCEAGFVQWKMRTCFANICTQQRI